MMELLDNKYKLIMKRLKEVKKKRKRKTEQKALYKSRRDLKRNQKCWSMEIYFE